MSKFPTSVQKRPWLLLAGLLAGFLGFLAFMALPASANHPGPQLDAAVQPEFVPGNPTCSDFLASDDFLFEFKLEPVEDGTFDLSSGGTNFQLTIDVRNTSDGQVFDFSFTNGFGVNAVVVKGGPDANLYDYLGILGSGVTSDVDLHAPVNHGNDKFYGLSHISFCIVQLETNITVTKSDDPDPVVAGNELTYTLDVTNTTNVAAQDVMVEDTLPSDVSFVSATPSQGTCSESSGVVTCDLGTLNGGATATVTIVVEVAADSSLCNTTITNVVDVSTSTPESDLTDNSDSEDTLVVCTNIQVVKSDSPDPVAIAGTLTYTLDVSNTTSVLAENVVVTDDLPAEVTFDSASPSVGSCSHDGTDPNGTVTCNLGDLAGGASESIDITVTVSSDTSLCDTDITNDVSVATDTVETTLADNEDSEDTTIICAAIIIEKDSTKGGAVSTAGAVFSVSGPSSFDVTDNGTNDENNTVGRICVSSLLGGDYTVNETTPPTGYGGASETDLVATAVVGTNCSDSLPTGSAIVTFTNPPLSDIQVNFRDGGSGETSLTSITCDNATGTDDTTTVSGWDDSLTVEDIEVTSATITVTCEIVIDP